MKIVIAPDKFKGSLSGIAFCDAVERGIKKHTNTLEVQKLPLADGGDGTVDAIRFYTGGEIISCRVFDPLNREIVADYLYAEKTKVAFIEMAEASGIRLLKNAELNPWQTTTYGTGQLINDALKRGAKKIILGIGGSATNDAGMGMARALGFRFYDKNGTELAGKGQDLERLYSIDDAKVSEQVRQVSFEVACDVNNPLYGKYGAAYVYSPQKGANAALVKKLDEGLQHFNTIVTKCFGLNLQNIKGGGAAGGLGAGCVLFLAAKLKTGIELIKDVANFDEQIKDANWIITGEGKFDKQTFSGKVIKGIVDARTAQKLAVFCGVSELSDEDVEKYHIDYIAEIKNQALNLDDSMQNAGAYLEKAAYEFAVRFLK
jgi:glycerate kinase